MERVQREISESGSLDQPSTIAQLSYLEACLLEAGRLYPPVPESIILDYSKTSFVAQKIRDEIREVAPGIYLGNAYWGRARILNFILQF